MSVQNLTLVDAIQIAMEAEKQAIALYSDAAEKTASIIVQKLFVNLAAFEQHHYDKLAELVASLQKKNKFIVYEGYPLPIQAQSEIGVSPEAMNVLQAKKVSMMDVITLAQNAERGAWQKYEDLAERTSDSDGKAMFRQLAKEEQGHLRMLTEVYWNLNDRGVWSWSRG
ncbi:MAG: hypothetical protein JW934_22030 [Anaerolineae bacterium]|nr:hypothetical protein [Anaerolineae bacterium]